MSNGWWRLGSVINRQLHHNQASFKLWPLSLLVLAILGMIVFLNGFVQDRDHLNLTCDASLYPHKVNDKKEKSLVLKVTSDGKKAQIRYDYFSDGHSMGIMLLNGKLIKLEVAEMTYNFRFTKGEIRKDIYQKGLPVHLNDILKAGREVLTNHKGIDISMQVTQMDRNKGYSIVKFDPGNNVWACRIN